jgi:HPt (histidine-containing phosphotransfer) domain-containing protein
MQAIRSLLKQEKYEDAYEEVHKITGGAGLQGFMDVSKAAGDLEMRLIAGRTAEIPRAFERLEQIVEAAVRGAKERQGD